MMCIGAGVHRKNAVAFLHRACLDVGFEPWCHGGLSTVFGERSHVNPLSPSPPCAPSPKQNLPEHAFKMLQPVDSSNGPASVERLSVSEFTWAGETTGATFRAACIPGTSPGRVQCGAKIIEGRRVTHLSFGIEVAELGAIPRALHCDSNGELDTVMEEVKDNVAEVPFGELEFVKELGQGVQVSCMLEKLRWLWCPTGR